MLKYLNFFIKLILILLPFSLFISTAISDILISFSGTLVIIILFLNKNYNYYTNKYFIYFIFFYAFIIICSVLSINILLSFESTLFYFRFLFFVIAIIYCFRTSKKFINYFFLSVLLSTSIVALDGIFEFLLNKNFLFFLENNHKLTIGRISGVFGDEYILGSYLVRLLPITLGLLIYLKGQSKKINIFILIYILLISSCILISGERTAMIMLAILFFMIFLSIKNLRSIILFFLLIFGSIAISAFSFDKDFKERLVDKSLLDIYKLNYDLNIFSVQHEVVYITSIKMFNDHKFFGIGPKIFRELCKKDKYKTFTEFDRSIDGCQTHPHNTYVQILTETGILGFIIFLIPVLVLYYKISKHIYRHCFKKINQNEIFSVLLLITIFINLWPLMPTGNFFNNYLSILYYIPIGFYFANIKNLNIDSKI